ncbi:hypothetical protein L4C36_15175, partial [Photobacterium japonica]
LLICRIFLKLGILKNTYRLFLLSSDLGKGSRLYNSGEFRAAFDVLAKYENTEIGDELVSAALAEIKYYLALMYYYGQGVNKDVHVANSLFSESAYLGSENAMKYVASKKEDRDQN